MKDRLNLASRRFGNERLPVLGFSVLCAALLAISVQHALAIRQLLPSRSSALHKEVTALQEEAARLRKESAELRAGPRPEKASIEKWQLVKDLVDRRVFRWTKLFACLADSLPEDVRLTGISPTVTEGKVTLDVEAVVKSMDAGLAFIQKLEQRPEFHDVYPNAVANPRPGEEAFSYVMFYRSDAAAPPVAGGSGR